MNSCRMTLRILVTLLALLALTMSAYATKIDTPTQLTVKAAVQPQLSVKADRQAQITLKPTAPVNPNATVIASSPEGGMAVGDDCSNPIPVSLDALPVTLANETTCGTINNYSSGTTCLGYYDGGEDRIYKLSVSGASTIYVKLTLNPKGTTWTGWAIGTSCPPEVGCTYKMTDYSGSPYIKDGIALAPGTYYLMVDTWPAPDCITDYDLIFEAGTPPPPPPPNDNCAAVTPVALPMASTITFTGNNLGATNDCSLTAPDAETWHAFTTTESMDVTVDYCGTAPVFGNVYIVLIQGCPCGSYVFGSSWETSSCDDGNWSVHYFGLPAGTWYIPVLLDPSYGAAGPYTINVTSAAPPPAPPNDNCADVTPEALTAGTPLTFTGNNSGATNDCSLLGSYSQAWHAFTSTETMTVTVDYCTTSPAFGNIYVALTSGCPCGSYTLYSSYDWGTCGDGNITIRYKNLPAGTWYIPVLNDPSYGAAGPYTIHVNGVVPPPPPPNDNCVDVTPVPLVAGTPLTFTGNNSGATNDCSLTYPNEETWHAFTTTTCMDVAVDYCTTYPVFGDVYIVLIDGCPCGNYVIGTWESSTCGDGNITIHFYGLAAGTWYIPVLVDPAYGAEGPYTIHVNGSAVSSYCPAGSNICDEYISNVTVGTINNSSSCGTGGYENWTALSTDMTQGLSYSITVANGLPYSSDQCGIWIDWNNDFCFSPDEQMTVSGTPGGGPYTATITAPCTVPVGSKLLRTRITYTGGVSPCGNTTYGEVEDYTINLLAHPVALPTAVLVPNPQFKYYEHALSPITNEFYVGNFGGGYLASDVNMASVTVNGLTPTGVSTIPSYTGIYCGALKVLMPLTSFLPPYGPLFDTTYTIFTVAGAFNDATPFSIDGDVTIIGHTSLAPGQYIAPPNIVVLPGDFNLDGYANVSDVTSVISYIFAGGAAPNVLAADVDCTGIVNVSDVVYYVSWIFSDGPGPARCGGN